VIRSRKFRAGLVGILVVCLIGGALVAVRALTQSRTHVTAYFANSNGIFPGDEVRILGVPVGKIDAIEPQPNRAKVTFWFDPKYQVPANVEAAIIAPSLVTVRAIQLAPAYTGGPTMKDNAVIPQERTAVPVEWDDVRVQLEKLTETLQPTQPGGVSTLGEFVNTTADNLRGQGASIRAAVIKLSQTFSALGDHSDDIFSTVRNLSILVSALHDTAGLLKQVNGNLAAATGLLANDPNEVGQAVKDLNDAVGDVSGFVSDNREALGTSSDRLASITTALHDSLDDIKQTLHIAPTAFDNFLNIYEPANGSLTGALALNNFANPISFVCGAIQAASRLGAEQSAKLCVQYLAPIVKNRQFNYPPLGQNFFVGAQARPNEVTYSEDWLRPDFVPPAVPSGAPPPAGAPGPAEAPPPAGAPLAAETPSTVSTNPADGLPGILVPAGGGS
jgi:phospholipid/cholesterol/gamma-HCH transport system substrate-binding protein